VSQAECRSCRAKIIWAKTVNNQSIPLDAEPVEDGNMDLQHGVATVVKKEERLPGTLLYKSHFATCPDAQKYRSKKV
jgi:hypothetical protein